MHCQPIKLNNKVALALISQLSFGRSCKEVELILHLLTEDLVGVFDVHLSLQMVVQQLLVFLLRVSEHVVLLPGEVGVAVADLELVGEPAPESGAGEEADGKEDGLLILHDGFVILEVLLHGRDGLDLHSLERLEVDQSHGSDVSEQTNF